MLDTNENGPNSTNRPYPWKLISEKMGKIDPKAVAGTGDVDFQMSTGLPDCIFKPETDLSPDSVNLLFCRGARRQFHQSGA